MPMIKIKILTAQELAGDKIVADFSKHIPIEITTFYIMEGGMTSGKTSVYLEANDQEGKLYAFVTSADIFRGMAGSLQGAEERFLLAKEGPVKATDS